MFYYLVLCGRVFENIYKKLISFYYFFYWANYFTQNLMQKQHTAICPQTIYMFLFIEYPLKIMVLTLIEINMYSLCKCAYIFQFAWYLRTFQMLFPVNNWITQFSLYFGKTYSRGQKVVQKLWLTHVQLPTPQSPLSTAGTSLKGPTL